jgi:hypothetical protein
VRIEPDDPERLAGHLLQAGDGTERGRAVSRQHDRALTVPRRRRDGGTDPGVEPGEPVPGARLSREISGDHPVWRQRQVKSWQVLIEVVGNADHGHA